MRWQAVPGRRGFLLALILAGLAGGWGWTARLAAQPPPFEPYEETLPGSTVKLEMVPIPGGAFELPDPEDPEQLRRVEIEPFWIGKTEVTWDAYDVYQLAQDGNQGLAQSGADAILRPSRPYGAPDRGFGRQGYPAISLTYHAAREFCRWLSARTGKQYRLPTEAEWEYACRAGSPPGENLAEEELDKVAWFWENSDDQTHPVGSKQPNAWGLFDMLGNAAEWCDGLDGKPVVRGGSWYDLAEKVHPGAREPDSPDWQLNDPQDPKSRWWLSDGPFIGFRIVREP